MANPHQIGHRFAHRPELKDLGRFFYLQRNRLNTRWNRSVRRVQRAKRVVVIEVLEWRDLSS